NSFEQICKYLNMVNAFFRAVLFGERSRPGCTGGLSASEVQARVPLEIRGDMSAKRRTHSGLGASTRHRPRIQASQGGINNKIKTFAWADKNFLTIFPEHSGANECCEPRR
ncbi:MAG: hypothetical protein ACJ8FJ_11040, partial [Sphingomicrobium sp.]